LFRQPAPIFIVSQSLFRQAPPFYTKFVLIQVSPFFQAVFERIMMVDSLLEANVGSNVDHDYAAGVDEAEVDAVAYLVACYHRMLNPAVNYFVKNLYILFLMKMKLFTSLYITFIPLNISFVQKD